jgi:hypothetical protein
MRKTSNITFSRSNISGTKRNICRFTFAGADCQPQTKVR